MGRRAVTTMDEGAGSAQREEPPIVLVDEVDAAFRALYAARYVPMVRLAALLVDRIELAEEIVQDSFAVVYQRWAEIDSPAGYLRTTVVNRCHDALRRRRLDRRPPPRLEVVVDEPDELADSIAALPRDQRMAVVLRFYEDMTVDEIAQALHARPGTVKSWLSRAMAQLRREITP
jgi:RNA polymerase sigma factor (sigma-70 family)